MDINLSCQVASDLAALLRSHRDELTQRWLERIAARVALEPSRIFPTDSLLDHVPLLIDGIADYLEDPSLEIAAEIPVIGKALELGELRFAQGFSAHEILKEYELLGGVLFAFLARTADQVDAPCTRAELLACAHRLFRAVSVIQQVTTTHYLRAVDERAYEREERLRSFNRMVSHELKNRIGAVLGAGQLLQEQEIDADPAGRARFSRIVVENASTMQTVLENLIALSRSTVEVRQQRNVLLPEVVAEVFRQLREMARVRGVEMRLSGELPRIEVNAAALELCLINYVSNAIKYCAPEKAPRWVEVSGFVRSDGGVLPELVVCVRDNGLGVPVEARGRLFDRFFRAHGTAVAGVEGTGMGLSIVRETMASIGGRAWAEFAADGSTFFLSLPSRRSAAAAASRTEAARVGLEANS